jgi:hypothetical protein
MLSRLRVLSSIALLPLLLGVAACQKGGPRTLHDSEGRTFEARCPADGPCKIEQKSGSKRADKPAQTLLAGGRLVGVCDVATPTDAPEGPYECRPLSCQLDHDCPPLHGMKDGQCLNQHCGDAAEAIGVQDAIMMCLAGTGVGRTSSAQIERYALALNCGEPCKVPSPCQQP